jgi:hypothetical protein
MTMKAELANAVYSMLEPLTFFHDHTGLVSAIGPLRAAQFNGYLRQAQAALSGVDSVYQIDALMEYDAVVTLVGRLTILKSIIDAASARQWLGQRD